MPELTLGELEALDPELDLFRAPGPVSEELLEAGLHPPLPVCGRCLVWGHALLRAARAAGKTALECRRLAERSPADLLALALALEARPGAYRWSEKLAMLDYARSRGFALAELAGLLEGRSDPRLEQKLEQFAGLPPGLRALVEDAGLDLRAADGLRDLPEEVFTLAASAPLTFSERRAFLGLLGGLDRDKALEAARAALRTGDPLETLRELAAPSLAALRRSWAALEAELVGGSGVTLNPPAYFEGDRFEVLFSFRTRQGLARRLRALARVEARFDQLGSFLR